MAIDIGSAAVGRPQLATATYTDMLLSNPANASGTIDTVEAWAEQNIEGLKVGTFFLISGTTYECRDVETLGSVTSGSKQTFSGLDMDVSADDYLAGYWASGNMERAFSGYSGIRWSSGDVINISEQTNFSSLLAGDTISLYGIGTEAGGVEKGPINSSVIIGVLPVADRTAAFDRDSSVIIGNLITASKGWGRTITASVIIGILASASRIYGKQATALVIVGILTTASRLASITRDALVTIGSLVTTSRIVTLTRGALVIVGELVTASRILGKSVASSVIIGVNLAPKWVSPTGHSDPDSAWTNETNAYDENTATFAESLLTANVWSSPLILTHNQIMISAIRFWGIGSHDPNPPGPLGIDVDIDLYNGAWVDVINTSIIGVAAWREFDVSPILANVTQARIRVRPTKDVHIEFKEFDFGSMSSYRVVAFTRSAPVIIGELVSASVAKGYTRLASVSIGVKISASGVFGYIRVAIIVIGIKVFVPKIIQGIAHLKQILDIHNLGRVRTRYTLGFPLPQIEYTLGKIRKGFHNLGRRRE